MKCFCFTVRYKQWLDSHADVLFRFNYDVEGGRFGEGEVRVGKYFLISRFDFSWCLTSVDYGTKDLKDALKELEEGKWDEYITEGEEETDKTDEISEKTQRETPKQEQKLEECEAKTNNQHEVESKENEEKETKVPQILSSNEKIINNNLLKVNNVVKNIRSKFNECKIWKRVISDAKYTKDEFLEDTGLIVDIRNLERKLKTLSRDIKKVNSDKKKKIFEKAFGMIQEKVDKLLGDIDEYNKKRKK